MIRLCVHLDAVAALRAARDERVPDVLAAGHAAMLGGADAVGVRCLSARRPVDERDVRLLAEALPLPLRVTIAPVADLVALAKAVKPACVCLAPEGGAGAAFRFDGGAAEEVARAVEDLKSAGIHVVVSVEPDEASLVSADSTGTEAVEIDASRYGRAKAEATRVREFLALSKAAATARTLGLRVHAGHDLGYATVSRVAAMEDVEEVEVGFAIAAQAVFTGFESAVREMRWRVAHAREEEAPAP